ncbi:MAG: hypothetical protein ACRCT8_01060 [Lacipirellulaceae bacterium]
MSSRRDDYRPPLAVRVRRAFGKFFNAIGDAFQAVVSPVERFFAALFRGVTRTGDAMEMLERFFVALLRWLTWPVRAVGRLLRSAVPRGVAESIDQSAENLRRVAGRVATADEAGPFDAVARGVAWVTWPLWRPVAGLVAFANAYIRTRSWRTLVGGVPAIVVAAPLLAIAVQELRQSDDARADPYRKAVQEATAEQDYKRVDLFERKLAQLGVDSRATAFRVAERFEEDGDVAGAFERMQALAPRAEVGYAPAHWWIVDHALRRLVAIEDGARGPLMVDHLDRLKDLGIENMPTALVRALVLADAKEFGPAAKLLEPYAKTDFAAAAERMRLLMAAGDTEAARDQASFVASQVAVRRRTEAKVTEEEYTLWAVAAQLRGDDAVLEGVAVSWLNDFPESDAARRLLAGFRRRQFETLARSASASSTEVARLLSEATRLDSPPQWMASAVALLLRSDSPDRVGERAAEELANSDETPSALLETLGAQYALRGDYERASTSLRKVASRPDPTPAALNNHAYVLMELGKSRAAEGEGLPAEVYAEALDAVNRALEAEPRTYGFRETRGQLLALGGEWRKAIDDLEFALNGMPQSAPVHATLAQAYEALGEKDVAAAHRALAQ